MWQEMLINSETEWFVPRILSELETATKQHGGFASAHEMYAVLAEEVDEVWDIVKQKRSRRSKEELQKELIQVAAMAMKALQCIDKFVDEPARVA